MLVKFLMPAILFFVMLFICTQDASAMYNARVGSFCSRDPIGYVGGNNLFQYVSARPLTLVDPSGLVDIETVNGPPQLPSEGSDPNGVYSGIWIKPTQAELNAFQDGERGYILITDMTDTIIWDCGDGSIVSQGVSNHQRRYTFQVLKAGGNAIMLPLETEPRNVSRGQPNPQWQYHQVSNIGLTPSACTRGRVTMKSVVKIFKTSGFVGGDIFVDPYEDGMPLPGLPQVPGEQIDEIGEVNPGEPITGGANSLGQATVRYRGRWSCDGTSSIDFHTATDDSGAGGPADVPNGPNRR